RCAAACNEKYTSSGKSGCDVSLLRERVAALSGLVFLASISDRFDIWHAGGGTRIISDSDAINTRAGNRSCAEAESFSSSSLALCRADGEQERRSAVQLFTTNQGEWQHTSHNRALWHPHTCWRIRELSLNRAGTI